MEELHQSFCLSLLLLLLWMLLFIRLLVDKNGFESTQLQYHLRNYSISSVFTITFGYCLISSYDRNIIAFFIFSFHCFNILSIFFFPLLLRTSRGAFNTLQLIKILTMNYILKWNNNCFLKNIKIKYTPVVAFIHFPPFGRTPFKNYLMYRKILV